MDNLTPIASPSDTEPLSAEPQKPFWQAIIEIGQQVPPEEWDKLPKDFARNAKHYMYGAPREEEEEEWEWFF